MRERPVAEPRRQRTQGGDAEIVQVMTLGQPEKHTASVV